METLRFYQTCARVVGWLALSLLTASPLLVGCAQESHDATRVLVSVMRDPALSLTRVTYRVVEARPAITELKLDGVPVDLGRGECC